MTVKSEFSNFADDWQKDISFFRYIISFDIFFGFTISFILWKLVDVLSCVENYNYFLKYATHIRGLIKKNDYVKNDHVKMTVKLQENKRFGEKLLGVLIDTSK